MLHDLGRLLSTHDESLVAGDKPSHYSARMRLPATDVHAALRDGASHVLVDTRGDRATTSAPEFAKLGYEVREMIGGFEYRARWPPCVQRRKSCIARAAWFLKVHQTSNTETQACGAPVLVAHIAKILRDVRAS